MKDQQLLNDISELAIKAGALILKIYNEDFAVLTKNDGSPVTQADKESEDLIVKNLYQGWPDIPVLAEEHASEGDIHQIGQTLGDEFFLVDPLDGTREFANKTGEFTVNIALVRNGHPILGVVYAPAIGRLYKGLKGIGAWRSTHATNFQDWEEIMVRAAPAKGKTAVASRSHRSKETEHFLQKINVSNFVAAGSSLKFCIVAEGEADVYPRMGRTMEWDTAAGQAILEAAGGSVMIYPDNTPLTYKKAARGFDNPHFIAWGENPNLEK